MIVPLPPGVRSLLAHNTHPGLLLDKYVPSWEEGTPPGKLSERVQKPAVRAVVEAARQSPPGLEWDDLIARRKAFLEDAKALRMPCETAGPLTLHLSRAGALENAGICLHPVYGFAYLPGSGLKGMARAYAETVWLPAQPKQHQPDAWRLIEDVFGWAPNPDRRKHIRNEEHPAKPRHVDDDDPNSPEIKAAAGRIVFHDAWPLTWPRLIEDIVNNHHRDYYGARDDHNGNPPGDWEEPSMVSFLAVPAGVAFDFPLAKRRSDVDDRLLKLAREWLLGGLTHLGAGAKTAAGYGAFRVQPADSRPAPSPLATFEATLELVTPAFLAGPSQEDAAGCDLRPATLRGLLRWWWRTLHAGFVDVATLRRMEAAVWGSTKQGGAVRLTVEPLDPVTRLPFDKGFIARMNKLPPPPNNKTTQGLWYHSYGMDEKKGRRFFVAPGTRWRVRLVARPSRYPLTDPAGSVRKDAPSLKAEDVLAQAKAALWLLCHCGGVGSKARKGFGSFDDPKDLSDYTADTCANQAAKFRHDETACRLPAQSFDEKRAETPALPQCLACADVPTEWKNYWLALDQVGDVAQLFAQALKHDLTKKGLGLPRNVRPPLKGTFRPTGPMQKGDRHASPVWYHFGKDGDSGKLIVRVTAFPARYLPDLAASRELLSRLLDHFRAELSNRVQEHRAAGPPVNPPAPGGGPSAATRAVAPMKTGSRVETVIVDDPKKKGRLFARLKDGALVGPIQNADEVPAASRAVGTGVTLEIASLSSDGRQIAFRWPKGAK